MKQEAERKQRTEEEKRGRFEQQKLELQRTLDEQRPKSTDVPSFVHIGAVAVAVIAIAAFVGYRAYSK